MWFDPTDHVPEPWTLLGPEPFDVTVDHLDQVVGPRRTLKAALLDQHVLAGVGNIAVSEVYWTLGLAPDVKSGALSDAQKSALVKELPTYFDWVISEQESEEVHYTGEPGADNPFTVYKREGEPCPRCGESIARVMVNNRSSYFCPGCQPAT